MNLIISAISKFFAFWLLLGIKIYKICISPFLPPSCRFYPSCSTYGYEAIRKFGPIRGSWMAMRRIMRCHPLNPGGLDPVPEEFPGFFENSRCKGEKPS